jgi:hypothetical protein
VVASTAVFVSLLPEGRIKPKGAFGFYTDEERKPLLRIINFRFC